MMTSRAIERLSLAWQTKLCMPGAILGAHSCSTYAIRGMYPYVSSKGANPVEPLTLKLMANSTMGTFSAQSLWSGDIILHRTCAIVLIEHSDAPSVWGWNGVDIRSLTLRSLCVSPKNCDVNLVSRSETIVSGSPCKWTISLMKSHANCKAQIVVFTGTRCTIEVSWQSMTHK